MAMTPNLSQRAEQLVRDWAKGWASFQPSENALQCLEVGVTELLLQTREEAVEEGLPEHEEWRRGFEQGKKQGLEEAANLVDHSPSHLGLSKRLRALASGSGERK